MKKQPLLDQHTSLEHLIARLNQASSCRMPK